MPASRKLYKDLAASLAIDVRVAVENVGQAYAEACVIRNSIAPALKRDNSNFDTARFFEACGLNADGRWIAS